MWHDPRKPTRLKNYDYATDNYYFITICTDRKQCIFGTPNKLNAFGKVAEENIKQIASHYEKVCVDKFVVMPNHVHMILVLQSENTANAAQIIAQYKAGVTRKIRSFCAGCEVWQRSFHDRIIRNEQEYQKIWQYIDSNPQKWEEDCFYCTEWSSLR